MITISKNPPLVALAKNPTVFLFTSDNYVTAQGTPADATITFSAGLAAAENFGIAYGNKIISFVVVSGTPDDSGLQIKAIGAESLSSWVAATANEIAKNYNLSNDYMISANGSSIVFIARANGSNYTMTLSNPPAKMSITDGTAGTDVAVRPFFNIVAQTWMKRNASMVKIYEDSLSVDSDGKVFYDISEIVKSELYSEFEWPEASTNCFVKREHINVPYFIRYAEQYGIPPVVKALETSQYLCALNGGVPFWKQVEYYTNNTSFWDRMQYEKNFLTWQPNNKLIDTKQPEKLYWLAWNNTLIPTACKLRVTLHTYDVNGAMTTTVLHTDTQAVSYMEAYEIQVGYEKLNSLLNLNQYFLAFNSDGYPGQSYDVEIVTDNDTILSEKRSYIIDYTEHRNVRYYIFMNSLGGYDTLRTTGIGEYESPVERTIISRAYPKEFDAAFQQKKQIFTSGTKKMKVNSGWISSEQAEWLMDMFLSEEVYEVKGDALFPIVMASTSGPKVIDEQTPKCFVEFEYEYCSHDSVFAKGTVAPTGGDFNEDFNPDFYTE